MGDEAELLREMVADREHRIVLIHHKKEEQIEKEERLHRELDEVQQLTTNQKIDCCTPVKLRKKVWSPCNEICSSRVRRCTRTLVF
jgi:hypothetical protein